MLVSQKVTAYAAFLFVIVAISDGAVGQSSDTFTEQFNRGTVKIVTGAVSNTYMRMAGEIAALLDKKNEIRVLPFMGYGGVRNIEDLLYLRGVDICLVHSDVLTHLTQRKLLPGALLKLRHIVTLYDEIFHIVARKEISQVEQLNGQPVVIGKPGSGSEMSAQTLFAILGITPKFIHIGWKEGVVRVRTGEAAAIVYPTPKVSKFLKELDGEGLHFLPLPINKELQKTYQRANLAHIDYPILIPAAASIQTLQFGAIMAAYNWEPITNRYKNVANFVDRFFNSLDDLRKPPRHPRWRKLNINAVPPGWKRFAAAQKWLSANASKRKKLGATQSAEYRTFMAHMRTNSELRYAKDGELLRLFNQFQEWKKQQAPNGR